MNNNDEVNTEPNDQDYILVNNYQDHPNVDVKEYILQDSNRDEDTREYDDDNIIYDNILEEIEENSEDIYVDENKVNDQNNVIINFNENNENQSKKNTLINNVANIKIIDHINDLLKSVQNEISEDTDCSDDVIPLTEAAPRVVHPRTKTRTVINVPKPNVEKGAIPKKFLMYQQKYQETLEKQTKVKDPKTKGKSDIVINKVATRIRPRDRRFGPRTKVQKEYSEKTLSPSKIIQESISEPVVQESISEPIPESIPESISESISEPVVQESIPESDNNRSKRNVREARVGSLKRPVSSNQSQVSNKILTSQGGKHVPKKYVKFIENDVKLKASKNIRTLVELKRINAINALDSDCNFDASKASMAELRKLRLEQRQKKQSELKKKLEDNKKDDIIQNILKNDKMTQLSKALAIKNLSINSKYNSKYKSAVRQSNNAI